MSVCTCVRIFVCMHVCMYVTVSVHVCTYVNMLYKLYIFIQHTCVVHVYETALYVCMYVCMHKYMYMCKQIA